MIWVGGGIVLHGLEEFGVGGAAHLVHDLAHGSARLAGSAGGAGMAHRRGGGRDRGARHRRGDHPLVGKVIAPAVRAMKGSRVGAS
jgi:hypothetical protein